MCRHSLWKYIEGERLPSVREMAIEAGVNPNTVQRAYETLETKGVLYSVRGSGWYITEKESGSRQIMERLQREKTQEYFAAMKALGMTDEEIKNILASSTSPRQANDRFIREALCRRANDNVTVLSVFPVNSDLQS